MYLYYVCMYVCKYIIQNNNNWLRYVKAKYGNPYLETVLYI